MLYAQPTESLGALATNARAPATSGQVDKSPVPTLCTDSIPSSRAGTYVVMPVPIDHWVYRSVVEGSVI